MAECTFVVTIGRGAEGIAKLVDITSGIGVIEFFESPSGPRLQTNRVPLTELRRIELATQTRVFRLRSCNRRMECRQGWTADSSVAKLLGNGKTTITFGFQMDTTSECLGRRESEYWPDCGCERYATVGGKKSTAIRELQRSHL